MTLFFEVNMFGWCLLHLQNCWNQPCVRKPAYAAGSWSQCYLRLIVPGCRANTSDILKYVQYLYTAIKMRLGFRKIDKW